MRIQNNVMAMNTHRMYTINNSNIQKSAEKLSSGYRINRAGDDAAGLAISEKMRSQIRGLNMASKNSQDAISLVQTAEGALQEVHSMLQRMNELSVQSATGTNQEIDRNQLAKEFNQLKREINDIAEQTTFNNMKILDGSLSNEGPQRSAQTAGIYATVSDNSVAGVFSSGTATDGLDAVTPVGGGFSVDLSSLALSCETDGAQMEITIGANSGTVTITAGNLTTDAAAFIAALDNETVTIGATTYTASVSGNVVTFLGPDNEPAAVSATIEIKKTGSVQGGEGVSAGSQPAAAGITGVAAAAATKAKSEFTIDVSKLKNGDKFEFSNGTVTTSITITDASLITEVDDLATLIGSGLTGFNVSGSASASGTLTIEASSAGAAAAVTGTFTSGGSSSYIEFDTTKLRNGDQLSLDSGVTTATWSEGMSLTDFVSNLGLTSGSYSFSGNTLTISGSFDQAAIDKAFKPTTDALATKHGTMRIQVGALENEQLNVEIKSMNSKGLGLDDSDLSEQDKAGKAITSTRDAINVVSDQRSLLGAMQNRLEHKISNLDNTSENLQSAESRIRDVDVAKEMTNYTKNNILAQASTAMLAQANAAPQSVLSLLQ